jgi:hypothetical protein
MRRWYAFACSHGGDVVCVEGKSGSLIWRTLLDGRANVGLALTGDLQARLPAQHHLVDNAAIHCLHLIHAEDTM